MVHLDSTLIERHEQQRFPVRVDVHVLPAKIIDTFEHAFLAGTVALIAVRINHFVVCQNYPETEVTKLTEAQVGLAMKRSFLKNQATCLGRTRPTQQAEGLPVHAKDRAVPCLYRRYSQINIIYEFIY